MSDTAWYTWVLLLYNNCGSHTPESISELFAVSNQKGKNAIDIFRVIVRDVFICGGR